jgi:hypothetical protein
MRASTRRGLVVAAVAVAVGVPVAAYAATDGAPPPTEQSETFTPPCLDGDAPDGLRDALGSPQAQALRDEHRAEMSELLTEEQREWMAEHRGGTGPGSGHHRGGGMHGGAGPGAMSG